ncbi:MAG: hypothetical protein FJ004_10830 [Chloroflexi bacterium]|nr:hypothetical protein [Chloroflexota bacterium]
MASGIVLNLPKRYRKLQKPLSFTKVSLNPGTAADANIRSERKIILMEIEFNLLHPGSSKDAL